MTANGNEHVRATDSEASPGSAAPVPTAGQAVARTLPACAVLVVAMPVALWWLLDVPSEELRTPWWPALLIGLVLAFHVLARLARAPRPPLPQVTTERVHCALVTASRSGAVASDPQVRTAAGVTACQRLESAVYSGATLTGVLVAWYVTPQPPWPAFASVAGALAVFHVVQARHSWSYLRALHTAARTG
ncbi:hypothetical protein ACFYE2_15140 [Kocuria sp. CPCC 205300]|uniref:hypothetical protein n=1 Tax=Kocuria sabuli TaxID=3071448 RepID=UPI0036DAA41A